MEDADAALPKATVLKVARDALPPDIRLASETQEVLLECSSEFVKLLATQANEVCFLSRQTCTIASLVKAPHKPLGDAITITLAAAISVPEGIFAG